MGCLVNPFFSLGIFLHMLQDSFTTAKDRGVEWFYPLTRLVKRGMYDSSMSPAAPDTKVKVYFYQEEILGYADAADPDLRVGTQPVPGEGSMDSHRTVIFSTKVSCSVLWR